MKKGFTLIELLAVIVILAIIALIAVPIVLNIIGDSKKSSDEQSLELYLDIVKKTIVKRQLSNSNFNPDKCEIQKNGNLKCYKEKQLYDIVKIEMLGKLPEGGVVTINNKNVTYKNIVFNGKKFYSISTIISDSDNNRILSIGDKYAYKVNNNDVFNFYVLSFNSDDTVNLIMDRNICEDGNTSYTVGNNYCKYKWESESINANGPITIMEAIYKATMNWINVPNLNFTYEDSENGNVGNYGYFGINIEDGKGYIIKNDGITRNEIKLINNKPIKARLPKYSEVTGSGCTGTAGSCPSWILENLRYWNNYYSINSNNISGTPINNILGYWLLSSYSYNSENGRNICYVGRIDYSLSGCGVNHGIRPVITVPISDLE